MNDIVWHQHSVTQEHRQKQHGHRACCIWFTGLSGAGKSTIAGELEWRLVHEFQIKTYLLDGDNVRSGLCKDLGFTEADRVENIRRIGEVSKLFVDAGLITLSAFISPFESDRRTVRAMFSPGEFIEIFVDAPLAVCEKRDPKGLYAKARRGELKNFTGLDSPYDRPQNPELTLNYSEAPPAAAVAQIIEYLVGKGYLSSV